MEQMLTLRRKSSFYAPISLLMFQISVEYPPWEVVQYYLGRESLAITSQYVYLGLADFRINCLCDVYILHPQNDDQSISF